MRRWIAGAAALVALAFAPGAAAQIIEDIGVKRVDEATAAIDIRFSVPVQFLRSATNRKHDLVQVYFRLAGAEEDGRTVEDFRKPPPNDLVPRFTVTYPIQPPAATRRIDVQFERPFASARVRPGRDNRSVRIEVPALVRAVPAPVPLPPRAAAPAPAADAAHAEVQRKAQALLSRARGALDAGRVDEAIERLNALLNLPPNAASREAQELVGVAREKRGEVAKARVEYELFLKLYPAGADAERVRKRLAALAPKAGAAAPPPAAAVPEPPRARVWGSISQDYYGGKTHSNTEITTVTPATNATTIDTVSLTSTDQSALVTNVDLNARYSAGAWDGRLVLRDTHSASLAKDDPTRNRLYSFYAEARHLPTQTLVRAGRQSSTFTGVLGRFDGIFAGTAFGPWLRLSLVAGRPTDFLDDLKPLFYAVLAEIEGGQGWGGNAYAIEQRVEGRTDRRAAGGELRYFDASRSLVASVDYDTSFRAVNAATVQATWVVRPGTTLNVLGDYRRSPSLELANALLTGRNLTLQQYLETFGEAGTREDARAVTPISRVAYAGFTQALGDHWQVGADVRYSSLSAVPEVGLLPATPGTGDIWTYSAQLVGSTLWGLGDVAVLNLSKLRGPARDGFSAGFTQRFQLRERWAIEPSLRYYRQRGDDVRLTRWSPGLRFAYRLRENVQLEAEATVERTRTTGPLIDDETLRHFYFVGYRWDF